MESGALQQRGLLSRRPRRTAPRAIAALAAAAVAMWVISTDRATAAAPKFLEDDPLATEPETQDASGATPYALSLTATLLLNLFTEAGGPPEHVRAKNVNSIDEVPDSSWFTNRIYATPLRVEEIRRGPNTMGGPQPGHWIVVGSKSAGAAPGFRVRDGRGETWFLTLDSKGAPHAATGAIAVACRLFWALGYHQVESYLSSFRPEHLTVADTATIETRPGHERRLTMNDVKEVLARAARNVDGSYRVLAARAIPGRILGGFRYHGTRPDDPNDLVPHEHRRELRALHVFAAWTNLVDVKALNTIDSVITDNGRGVVRHYLQDVGSTFGAAANGPHDYDEGHEYLFEGGLLWRRLISFGFYLQPWQVIPYYEHPEIGRIEVQGFDPEQWKSRAPIAPIRQVRDDDTFWAALRVGAFTDDLIRAAVHEGQYTDPAAETMLSSILIQRRDAIVRHYVPKITPLTAFALDAAGTLTFENAAVRLGVASAPADGYRAVWVAFDNATGGTTPLGAPVTSHEPRVAAPVAVQQSGSTLTYLKVSVSAIDARYPDWERPADVYFRRITRGWALVGLDRAVE